MGKNDGQIKYSVSAETGQATGAFQNLVEAQKKVVDGAEKVGKSVKKAGDSFKGASGDVSKYKQASLDAAKSHSSFMGTMKTGFS